MRTPPSPGKGQPGKAPGFRNVDEKKRTDDCCRRPHLDLNKLSTPALGLQRTSPISRTGTAFRHQPQRPTQHPSASQQPTRITMQIPPCRTANARSALMPTTQHLLCNLVVILTENIGVWLHPGLRRGGLSTGHFSERFCRLILQNPPRGPKS